MPQRKNSLPKYRRKLKPNGPQAVVTIAGRDHYLGPFGSRASKQLYDQLVSEWLAAGRPAVAAGETAITITELIGRYWRFAKDYYRPKANARGKKNSTAQRLKPVLRALRLSYGPTIASEFGPLALKAFRQKLIDDGLARRTINDDVDRIRRMFKWAASEELIDESVYRRLTTVDGLRKGRSGAKETSPIPPVSAEIVDRTLMFLPRVVADMVQFARLTGARPGEVCQLRPCDIQKHSEVWFFTPQSHKTEHRDKARAIPIGPKAQKVIEVYLDHPESDYCFDPRETVEIHYNERNARRRTKAGQGNCRGDSAKKRGGRKRKDVPPGECYTNDSFRRAIHRACDRAFPPPEPLAQRDKESNARRLRCLTKAEKLELKSWQSEHRWAPNQLRHSAATEIREKFGIEAVAAVLGHSQTDVSEIYAERNLQLAATVAKEIG